MHCRYVTLPVITGVPNALVNDAEGLENAWIHTFRACRTVIYSFFLFFSNQPQDISNSLHRYCHSTCFDVQNASEMCSMPWFMGPPKDFVVNMRANSIKQYYLNYGCQVLDLNNETKLQNIFFWSYTKDIKLKFKISTTFIYSNSPTVQFSISLSLLNILRRKLTKIKIDKNI